MKKFWLLVLMVLSVNSCGGMGTASKNPPGPTEVVSLGSPCYEISMDLLEGWELLILEPDDEREEIFKTVNLDVPTSVIAYLTEPGLETEIKFVYSWLDTNLKSFEEFVLAPFNEYSRQFVTFAEIDDSARLAVFTVDQNPEKPGKYEFIIYMGIPDSGDPSIMHILWFIGITDGEGPNVEERFKDAVRKLEQEFLYMFGTLNIKPKSCNFGL